MKNKIFLAIILLTPILVVTFSSLFFTYGYSPEGTRNNGVFFKSYFNFEQFNQNDNEKMIEFEDGKWVMAVYITDPEKSSNSLYLMRQLNVALNRDIYKVKRVAFYSNKLIKDGIDNLINEYPRTELVDDKNGVLLNVLQKNSDINISEQNPIFIIDPYGRAVMYFNADTDPKKILKDLKVLI
ncbi:hypothetical protein N9J53_02265 [Gammaproteobacteria bacterium]|nr:hypothetical protein [Gammaproteobacteria bacterium]